MPHLDSASERRPDSTSPGVAPRSQPPLRAGWFTLAVFAAACALLGTWGTLRLPYLLDDLDHLRKAALLLSGQTGWGEYLFGPMNEHTIPIVVLLFLTGINISGLDAIGVRLLVLLSHVAGAVACGLISDRLSESPAAKWVGVFVYAGAVGSAGSTLWCASNSPFGIAATFVAFAWLALLEFARGRRRIYILAVVLVLLACGALNGVAVVALGMALWVFLSGPGPSKGAVWKSVFIGAMPLLALVLTRWNYTRYRNVGLPFSPEGVLKGLWILYTAPLSYFAGWFPIATPSPIELASLAIVPWIAVLVTWRYLSPPARRLLACSWIGFFLLALVIGLARSSTSLLTLFLTDRYYYAALLPLCVQFAVLISMLLGRVDSASRTARWSALFVLCLLGLVAMAGSRAKFLKGVYWDVMANHERALVKGRALVGLIDAAAEERSGPVTLADGEIPFDGIHKDRIALSTLFYVAHPAGRPGVRLTQGVTDAAGAAFENRILDGWGNALGVPSPVCVEGGKLKDVRGRTSIDFRRGAFESSVIGGFHLWERTYRWMSREGVLELERGGGDLVILAHAPIEMLRKRWPDLSGVRVRVVVDGRAVGEMFLDTLKETEFRFHLDKETRPGAQLKSMCRLQLVSEFAWRGVDLNPPLLDERQLSIAVIAAGFPDSAKARTGCQVQNR